MEAMVSQGERERKKDELGARRERRKREEGKERDRLSRVVIDNGEGRWPLPKKTRRERLGLLIRGFNLFFLFFFFMGFSSFTPHFGVENSIFSSLKNGFHNNNI